MFSLGYMIIVCNIMSFCFMAYDKLQAKLKKRRISERLLLILILLGGIGGLFSMFTFRHKIRKWYFVLASLVGTALSMLLM